MALTAEKDACRAAALERRKAMGEELRADCSLALCRSLAALEELQGAKTVLGYVPTKSECDLRPLYDALRERGVTLAFPVTDAAGNMEACVPAGDLVPGRFGILEPDAAASRPVPPEELDAVLVPCIAFDGSLCRLGHGMGFYDRYLPRACRAAAILTAFEAQRIERVPRESHDLSFSVLVTERGVFRK